jgi:hypothetical protein
LMGPPSSSPTNLGSCHEEGHRNGESLSEGISGVMLHLQNANAPARSCFTWSFGVDPPHGGGGDRLRDRRSTEFVLSANWGED